jgi:hypothetical protein
MRRLRAVRAVLRAPPRLHAEERAELDFIGRVVKAMDRSRVVDEGEQRAVVEGSDLLASKGGSVREHAGGMLVET